MIFFKEDMAAFSDAESRRGGARRPCGLPKGVLGILRHRTGAQRRRGRDRSKFPRASTRNAFGITGNVAGQPPFRGTLKHHGWEATAVRLPAVSDALDPRVLVAAEVEL